MSNLGKCLCCWGIGGMLLGLLLALGMPAALAQEDVPVDAAAEAEDAVGPWFLFMAMSNLHPRLDETEELIDLLINKGLGSITPRYEKPETFSDWSDDFKLWEFMVGFGRHLSPRWAWYMATGFIAGKTKEQTNLFPLLLPLKTEVDFERSVRFVTSGIDYYPWGKSFLPPEREGESRLLRRLRGARPYGELATGYVHVHTEAPARVRTFGGKQIIRYNRTAVYDMTYISPRLGVDIPLTDRDTMALQAGYLFFDKHKREYNNASYYIIYKHAF